MNDPEPSRETLCAQIATLRARLEQMEAERRRAAGSVQAQTMEAVGRLAGGIAHDFNNLLTVINGYASLLLTRLPPGTPARELAREVQKAGERAVALTQQLLALSRRLPVAPVVLDLNALVRGAEKILGPLLGGTVEMITTLDPDLGRVRADRGQVEHMILSLALNAREAMAHGGRLVLETRQTELSAELGPDTRPGVYALLAVSDSGGGMDEATRARVFEPFFATKEKGRGTGLALAAVYGIVKQSGGHIEVDSRPGQGTTFRVYLPCVGESGAAPDAPTVAAPTRRETVLLVEDEEAVLSLARMVLESHGYTVLAARSGEEALSLAALHAGPIPLLLTDVIMPQLSGCELADRLLRDRPGLRVLYLSGYVNDSILQHDPRRQNMAFLAKPFTPSVLARKVREVLDRDAEPAVSAV